MKICYLTWGETPRSYGVFGSQVIGQFMATKKQMPESEFYFISGIPLIHSGFVREKLKYGREIDEIKKKLDNVKFILTPIFAPQNFVNSSKSTFGFMHYGAHRILKNHFQKINPDIVHCRSYHAAWAALKVRTRYNFNYKIIFDARGLWPEEISLKKEFSEESKNYKFLKSIESELLCKCDFIIGVSDTMVQHYKELGAKNVECVYLSADIAKLKNIIVKENREYIHFGYIGGLADNTWHKPLELLSLYKEIRKEVKNSKLFIITTSNHNDIRNIFSEISEDELVLTSTKTVDELKLVLNNLDFGLMSYFKPLNKRDILLANMVLAVKTAEYIAAGLPMIVNKMCGGASSIIDKYNMGISYDPNSFEEINENNITSFVKDGKNIERSDIAEKLFDYKSNALKYKSLYDRLYKLQ